MLGVIVNEKEQCEKALNNNELPTRPMKIIRLIIKKYLSEGKSKDKVYELIDSFMEKSYEGYNKNKWKNILMKAIEDIKEYNNLELIDINRIIITKVEWDKILELDNSQLERLAFALLCYQKVNEIKNPLSNGWINVDLSNVFKEAKIQRGDETKKLLFELKKKEYISLKNSCDSSSIKINYNIKDEDLITIDSLKDNDIITYYYELTTDKKYKKCSNCGKRFELKTVNSNQVYCQTCAKKIQQQQKNEWKKRNKEKNVKHSQP